MKHIHIYIIISFFLSISGFTYAQSPQEHILKAEQLYEQQEFDSARALYHSLIEAGYESADIFYNLGNTYFRRMDIAHAILWYERAFLRAPRDPEIVHNLAFAHAQQVDKIESVGQGFFKQIYTDIYRVFLPNTWTVISIICFLIFLAGIALFLFSRAVILKKLGFFTGLFFMLCALATYATARSRHHELTAREYAIILEPTVSIKTEPTPQSRVLTVVHGGLKVTVLQERNSWSSILLEDGKQGWIESIYIERI